MSQWKYSEHKEHYKKHLRNYNTRIRAAIFDLLGNECVRCGFSDIRALQVDHINGGGHQEKKKVTMFYPKYVLEKLVTGDKSYQLLCANCNWIKRIENKENRI